jgi:voltage-gated potassium channel
VLAEVEHHAEPVMAVLSLVWLALFIFSVVHGLDAFLSTVSTLIWIAFIADYVLRLVIAPDRWAFIRGNWLLGASLLVPALRILRFAAIVRVLRVARAARGVRLLRAVTSLNRGMRALGGTMHRRGFAYVATLSIAVTLAGAAGMYALEPHAADGSGFAGYGDALWWTSMIMTTLGSAYWPRTAEGRILAFLLSLYAIGVFGYITATLASFFVDRDAAATDSEVASTGDLRRILRELAAVRADTQALRRQLEIARPRDEAPGR